MLSEMYIFFTVVMLVFWIIAFLTKQEILWTIALVLSGVLAFTSFNIEYYTYVFNATTTVYDPVQQSTPYPYLMGIQLIFFALALIFLLFDLFDKYKGPKSPNEK